MPRCRHAGSARGGKCATTFRRIGSVALVAALAVLAFTATARAAGESYGGLSDDWTRHVQSLLTHAAMKNPKWHSQRQAIERHIEHIGALLQGALLAIRASDYAVAGINLQHAVRMLDVGVTRGFYRRTDVEPLKLIIAGQMPDAIRHNAGTASKEGR